MEETYFRKGFGLKAEVKGTIDAEYHSALVERIRARGYQETFGDVTVRLAQEFGFCYGVDRAVDYAYETVHKFPDRRIFLVGEIIHNPHVNRRMTEMGIRFIYPDSLGAFDFSDVTADDVVILPAFGVPLGAFHDLRDIGCILVDTTCGSVLHVWKRVDEYARDGFTALIHGKYYHEESRATASQVSKHPNGKYVIVRDIEEAMLVCDYVAGRPRHQTRQELRAHFAGKASAGFDPERDLQRIGVANQTTMLANESLAIGAEVRKAMVERFGEEHASTYYRSFGTICSATQERQDAVVAMMADPPDRMIVIGGYNSSNTNHLAHMCRQHTTTYHVQDAACIEIDTGGIRHEPELAADVPERLDHDWLPARPFTPPPTGSGAGAWPSQALPPCTRGGVLVRTQRSAR